jgi:exopolysaccharide biosynthesis polyprenyl glycosylphosphotransferase
MAVDLAAALIASLAAFLLRWGPGGPTESLTLALVLPVVWLVLVASHRLYATRFLCIGSEEFRRIGRSGVALVAVCGTVAYVAAQPIARGFVLVALPLTVALDAAGRYSARKVLHARRRQGRSVHRVLLVGRHSAMAGFLDDLGRDSSHGLQVVGVCYVDRDLTLGAVDRADFGGLGDIAKAVETTNADTVAVLASPETSGATLRQIAWDLEGCAAELVIAPGLVEVAGPRLTIRPVSGLPLLHLERPELTGGRRLLKACFDRSVALVALVLLLPLLLLLALVLRVHGGGPVIYRQTRVGVRGKHFTMFKLRSMCPDADARRTELLDQGLQTGGPLFKIRKDPRVTSVGRLLRQFSLDELPQLVNVLLGDMSLVGPRPPLPEEVEQYGRDVHRRLLVKPGLTGLWQVSGRSTLTWEESVRLDLRYVDNWSLALDLLILWKTARAVLLGAGAY